MTGYTIYIHKLFWGLTDNRLYDLHSYDTDNESVLIYTHIHEKKNNNDVQGIFLYIKGTANQPTLIEVYDL